MIHEKIAAEIAGSATAAPMADFPMHVYDVLNFALTLEHLEAEFYTRGLDARGLLTGAMRVAAEQIRKHEVAHVRVLRELLGARAVAKPNFDFTAGARFGDVFSNARTFMALAQGFEDTGVRAYKGQAAHIMTQRTLLQQALRIHSVEARHSAQIRRLRRAEGWITSSSRDGLPESVQDIYDGEGNLFHFILAQPSSNAATLSAAFDEPLTKSQVITIVEPFIAGGLS